MSERVATLAYQANASCTSGFPAENDELSYMLEAMRLAGIRRVPVVDTRGALIGIMARS